MRKIQDMIEKVLHYIFEIGILLKGIGGIIEVVGGLLALLAIKIYLVDAALEITQEQVSQDPNDVITSFLLHISHDMSISTQYFIAFYLLSHGLVKVFLVVGLFKRKLWAYPVSIVIFVLFIIYQMYRYFQTDSVSMLVLTVLDVFLIWLTVHEYKYLKKRNLIVKN
jgi:uncharacterized membrane protein